MNNYIVHPAVISDWSENSFIMVVYDKNFLRSVRIFCPSQTKKNFSQTTVIKLILGQSEVSALPVGCIRIFYMSIFKYM